MFLTILLVVTIIVDEEPLRRELEEIEEEEEEEEEGNQFSLTDVVDREVTRFGNHTCPLFLLAYNFRCLYPSVRQRCRKDMLHVLEEM